MNFRRDHVSDQNRRRGIRTSICTLLFSSRGVCRLRNTDLFGLGQTTEYLAAYYFRFEFGIPRNLRCLAKGVHIMQNRRPLILVVDDERIIAETLVMILEGSGFHAKAFMDPLEALSAVAGGSELPDMLISDVMMPRLSGVDLAIKIKELCPNCKVLLFSGQAQTMDLLQNASKEGHDFRLLSKPIHPSDLLRQVRYQELMSEPSGLPLREIADS